MLTTTLLPSARLAVTTLPLSVPPVTVTPERLFPVGTVNVIVTGNASVVLYPVSPLTFFVTVRLPTFASYTLVNLTSYALSAVFAATGLASSALSVVVIVVSVDPPLSEYLTSTRL